MTIQKRTKKALVGSFLALGTLVGIGAFDSSEASAAASVTVPDRTVSVLDYGAVPDDGLDDRLAFQNAIDDVSGQGGGTITVPHGNFNITLLDGKTGLIAKSNIHLKMSSGTNLRTGATDQSIHRLILITTGENIKLSGGNLIGERYSHIGTTGEWGHGIHLYGGAKNIEIDSMYMGGFWGDGIILESNGTMAAPTDVTINRVFSDNNRRQGLSIVAGENVLVQNSTFQNTNGTAPASGIDVEQDPPYDKPLKNIKIFHNVLQGNAGEGLTFAYGSPSDGVVGSVEAKYNIIRDNSQGGVYLGQTNKVVIEDNLIESNGGNSSSANFQNGIFLNFADDNKIVGNDIKGNVRNGIRALNSVDRSIISDNNLEANSFYGAAFISTTDNTYTNNRIVGNTLGETYTESSTFIENSGNGSSTVYTAPAETVGITPR